MEKSLRSQIQSLGYQIIGDIDHGECFHEKDMLDEFIANLDKMKELALAEHEELKKEFEAE